MTADGLRERKKRETLEAIQRAAVELCLRQGYENVTVDMICRSADISARTFFNYVGSKENAVLADTPPLPDARRSQEYVAGLGGTPFEDLVRTLVGVASDVGSGRTDLMRLRFALIRRSPQLRPIEFARMARARDALAQLVRQRLRADDDGARAEAELTVTLALGIVYQAGRHSEGPRPGAIDGILQLARRVIEPSSE